MRTPPRKSDPQPFGFVFDANASSEVRPGAYASLTGPFIMALGPLGAGVYGPYGALGPYGAHGALGPHGALTYVDPLRVIPAKGFYWR